MTTRPCREAAGIAGAILSGGEASRFGGRAKGLLRLASGVSILERTLKEVDAAGIHQVAVFANDLAAYAGLGCAVVADHRRGIGPLAGIETALRHFAGRCKAVLILPCDLPGITSREIQTLCTRFAQTEAQIVVAETGDSFWHPLCTIVHSELRETISRGIEDGWRSVHRLWRCLGAVSVHFPDGAPFLNINTPEDWAKWRSRGTEAGAEVRAPAAEARRHSGWQQRSKHGAR